MNDAEIEAVFIDRLAHGRNIDRVEVVAELVATNGGIDSLEGVELVAEAERSFGIAVSDKEIASELVRSVPALVALVRSKCSGNKEAKGGRPG